MANTVAEEAPGRILVGTHGDGLMKWEAGRVSTHELWSETNRPESTYILSVLKARNGELWVGCYLAGLNRLFAGGWESIPSAKAGPRTIRSLFEDRDGRLWVGSSTGLAVREGGEFRACGPETGLPDKAVCAIGQDGGGRLWVYGFNTGLFREQAGRFERFRVPGLETNTAFVALLGTRDGSLWIGTNKRALCRVQGETVFVYGERHGLPPVEICGLLEDDAGDLWLACLEGVVRLGRHSLDLVARQPQARLECQMFDKRDGLAGQVRMTLQPVCCKASDGRLWFATVRGLAVVDPKVIPPKPAPATVVLDELLVDHKLHAGWNEPGKRLRLPPTSRHVDFRYSVIRLGVLERILFQRRLHPDDSWQDAGKNRLAEYEDLPPGRYQFEVRAADNDEVWGAAAVLAFEVRPYYWQTAWFRLAVLLVAGSLVWGAYHWRVAGLEERRQAQTDFSRRLIASQEEERKRIAAELHDGLGQHLLVIKNMAAMGIRSEPDEPAKAQKFTAISSLASQAIGEVRQMSRALRPVELDRLGLTKALTWLIKPAADSTDIRFDVELDELDGLFPPEFEINLYRVVQECLANVLKHSQATTARVQIKREPLHVRMTIQDNGRGFVPPPAGGMGLTHLAERVRILGGEWAVESAPGAGTLVRFLIPLPEPGRASKPQTETR